jgi:hypothetical protein
MKKLLILFVLLFLSMSAYAEYWYEYSTKAYIDLDSVSGTQYQKRAWVKTLNPGDWELEKNKKVWYWMTYEEVKCSSATFDHRTLAFTSYDIDGKYLSSFENRNSGWSYVIPGTRGYKMAETICGSPVMER